MISAEAGIKSKFRRDFLLGFDFCVCFFGDFGKVKLLSTLILSQPYFGSGYEV